MERSPAEVSMGRHSPEPAAAADLEQRSSDTTRRTSTTESYRARKRQFEKKPGSIWSVTSRSSLAIPIFVRVLRSHDGVYFQTAIHDAVSSVPLAALIVCALPRGLPQTLCSERREGVSCSPFRCSAVVGARLPELVITLPKRANIIRVIILSLIFGARF